MKTKLVRLVCDECSKSIDYNPEEMLIGGSHGGGWLHLNRTGTGTALCDISFQSKEGDKDFCSYACLSVYAARMSNR